MVGGVSELQSKVIYWKKKTCAEVIIRDRIAKMTTARHRVFIAICPVMLLSITALFLLLERNHSYLNQRLSTFSRSFRYREFVAEQQEASTSAMIDTDLDEASSTLTPSTTLGLDDIMYREQEQRQRTLAAECRHLNISEPTNRDYTHLLVNDAHKILFNFIPKVSCKMWKKIWGTLRQRNTTGKLLLQYYKGEERYERLETYRKVLFVREPMSRLLSAYMSKFRGGVLYNHGALQRVWEKKFGRAISKRYRGVHDLEDGKWLNITLIEFITYITDLGSGIRLDVLNDHWMPQYIVSRPCHIKYDFIGHFENLAVEGPYVLRLLGVDHLVKFPEYQSSNAIINIVEYYKLISLDLMRKLMDYYSVDYRLFGYSPDDVISQLQRGVFEEYINIH